MNPYEHAQQPATPEPPSGLPIAGSPPPAYDPDQGYAPAPTYPQPPPAYQPAPPPGPPVGGGWGAPPEGPPPYIITAGAPGLAANKSGVGKKLALIAVAVLVIAGGGGAFAADAWAKGQVCD